MSVFGEQAVWSRNPSNGIDHAEKCAEVMVCVGLIALAAGGEDRRRFFVSQVQRLIQEERCRVPGLQTAHETQNGAGQRAVIHRRGNDDIVKIVIIMASTKLSFQ